MAQPELECNWGFATDESVKECFNLRMGEPNHADVRPVLGVSTSLGCNDNRPKPPPLPPKISSRSNYHKRFLVSSYVSRDFKDAWDRLFKEGYETDVHVVTEDKTIIPAHSIILSIISPVLRNFLKQAKLKDGIRYIEILGVPSRAVCVFIRFLYSASYEEDEMKNNALHLLVLSHSFSVPSLKRVCTNILEQTWLTTENVIDVLELARQCDAPRLSLICVRMVVKNFKKVSSSEGWKVMKRVNPELEQELLESIVEADSGYHENMRKNEEKKMYLQLHEAMEALLHICKDGCRTIGPRDKVLKGSQITCSFPACKGLETLVRHFSICKVRVPGGCSHCKRMWQLLELHSRMCNEPATCKVPLCRHFKDKMQQQSKKDETKWRLLVSKVVAARSALKPWSTQKRRMFSA